MFLSNRFSVLWCSTKFIPNRWRNCGASQQLAMASDVGKQLWKSILWRLLSWWILGSDCSSLCEWKLALQYQNKVMLFSLKLYVTSVSQKITKVEKCNMRPNMKFCSRKEGKKKNPVKREAISIFLHVKIRLLWQHQVRYRASWSIMPSGIQRQLTHHMFFKGVMSSYRQIKRYRVNHIFKFWASPTSLNTRKLKELPVTNNHFLFLYDQVRGSLQNEQQCWNRTRHWSCKNHRAREI